MNFQKTDRLFLSVFIFKICYNKDSLKIKNTMCKNKGFTLIELLVVIAIIGILATIVLSSLNSAREEAKDVVIKTEISHSLRIAELFWDEYGDYNGLCAEPELAPGGTMDQLITKNGGSLVCEDTVDGFCISSTLNRTGSFCADPIGRVVENVVCNIPDDILCD